MCPEKFCQSRPSDCWKPQETRSHYIYLAQFSRKMNYGRNVPYFSTLIFFPRPLLEFPRPLLVASLAAFHVGRPEYVRRELGKNLGVQKNAPRLLAYWSQKILWMDEFFTVFAYCKQKWRVISPKYDLTCPGGVSYIFQQSEGRGQHQIIWGLCPQTHFSLSSEFSNYFPNTFNLYSLVPNRRGVGKITKT